jgi:hypothetical protein
MQLFDDKAVLDKRQIVSRWITSDNYYYYYYSFLYALRLSNTGAFPITHIP